MSGKRGKYQMRFEILWGQLVLVEAKNAGELSAFLVSKIIGCSERHAERMIWRKIKQRSGA